MIRPQDLYIRAREMEKIFNKFRSGAETLYEAINMSHGEFDAVKHGEMGFTTEQIDELVGLGFGLSWIMGQGDPKKVIFEEKP